MSENPVRAYRSALRERQAHETRDRVIRAAGRLFALHGFQATTMAAIAREAGVSTETVKATAAKSDLLIAAFELTFSGAEGERSLADTPAAEGILAASGADFLPAVIEAIAAANERGHGLWTVVLGAALSDAGVAASVRTILAQRGADYRRLITELAARGVVAADPDAAAAELSFLLSPEGYQQLVAQSGWTREQYVDWLILAARRTLGSAAE